VPSRAARRARRVRGGSLRVADAGANCGRGGGAAGHPAESIKARGAAAVRVPGGRVPLGAAALGPKASATVSINACWAIAEVYQHAARGVAGEHLGAIVPALVAILQRRDVKQWQLRGHDQLLGTVCATLNRLRQEEKKVKLEAFFTEPFGKMKEGTLESSEVKSASAEILKIGKEYSFDPSLLTSIPSAIAKKPEERGPFDSICLQQVEDELKKKIAEMIEKLTAMEPAKAEKAAELAAAETAMAAAQQKELDSKDALNTAKEEEKASEEALKAAKDAVKDFMPEMSAACDAVDEAKAEKETLTDTALTPFKELVEWSNVVPEPEPEAPAEEAPAAEAPAAEAPAA